MQDDTHFKYHEYDGWISFAMMLIRIGYCIYFNFMVNETYDYDFITKRIKQIFLECKDDRKKFAETVIEYFTPTDREKKNNAEIPTPRELKLEMTSKVPLPFWTEKQKVLEPSVGKGGFCLEVIEFFMIGLKEKIPDENERYKIIAPPLPSSGAIVSFILRIMSG